jgi:hypothetical protein
MHQSSIGLLVCPKCGYSMEGVVESSPWQGSFQELPYEESYVKEASSRKLLLFANMPLRQKRIILVAVSCFMVFSVFFGFYGYNDYQAGKVLDEAIAQDRAGRFDEAGKTLDRAKSKIAFPSTKNDINQEIANNKRWKEYYSWHKDGEALVSDGQYSSALDLLNKIKSDYPLYDDVNRLIAIAEANGNPDVIARLTPDDVTVDDSSDSSTGSDIVPAPSSSGTSGRTIRYTPSTPTRPSQPNPTPPTPINPPAPPPTPPPAPTKYVYKGDGVTRLGTYVSGSGCVGVVYNSGGGNYTLNSYDCGIDYGPPPAYANIYYSASSCGGSVIAQDASQSVQFIFNGINYYSNGSLYSGDMMYGPRSFFMLSHNVCQNSFNSSTKYNVYAAPPHVCGANGTPCTVR